MPALPTGTVTLMFTDIAGSTALLHELKEAYPETLAEHRRALRAVFDRHHGVEVDTQGDAFFVVFQRASDAVAAARDAQAELRGPVRVRIGLHTGEPLLTDEGYVGLDVHIAARIGAAGHGGQVLLSSATRELAGAKGTRDLGSHQLKDVGAVNLYQLGEADFPALRSLNRTNLPAATRPLVGRTTEIDGLRRLIRDRQSRLVTVAGAGGMGKTSLAIEAASGLLDAFSDGIWLVDLAPVSDATLVESTIAAVLGTAAEPREYLRDRDALLLLDNFEHVIDAAAVVAGILDACPGVSVLATSREPLRLRGESEFPLSSLDQAAAASLFRERAAAVMPSFDADSAQVEELVRRLEGIPLAIELAAARVKLLSPDQMLERLESRLSLLTGGARDLPERQRTLEATIAWSFALLEPRERELFARLGVFAGGATLEATESVCDADLDGLQSLVDKSLVRVIDGRFEMLETIHEYAEARLREAPDSDDIRLRHVRFYVALAERAEPQLTGAHQGVWLARLGAEHDNFRAALEWCSNHAALVAEGLRLGGSLAMFWFVRGFYREGLHWLEPLLAADAEGSPSARTGALWGAGLMWTLIGDSERAQPLLEECLELARAEQDDSRIARALDMMGLLSFFANDLPAARTQFEESIAHARAAGDDWCLIDSLATVGSIYPLQGAPELAVAAGTEALTMARRNGDQQGLRMALFGLALAAFRRGDLPQARTLAEEGLGVVRGLDDAWFIPYFLWVLATVAMEAGEYSQASEFSSECLQHARELEAPMMLVCALEAAAAAARGSLHDDAAADLLLEAEAVAATGIVPGSYVSTALTALGRLQTSGGDNATAERTLERSLAIAREVGDPWAESRALNGLAQLLITREDLVFAEPAAARSIDLALGVGDQLGVASSIETLAAIAALGGDFERAAIRSAAADTLRARLGSTPPPWARSERATALAKVTEVVGADRYEALAAGFREASLAEIRSRI